MNQQALLRQHLKPDTNRTIHIKVPEHMGDDVDVLITPSRQRTLSDETRAEIALFEETAFARDVLNSKEEDCWNDL